MVLLAVGATLVVKVGSDNVAIAIAAENSTRRLRDRCLNKVCTANHSFCIHSDSFLAVHSFIHPNLTTLIRQAILARLNVARSAEGNHLFP